MPALNSQSIVDEFKDTVKDDVEAFEKVIVELIEHSIKATARLRDQEAVGGESDVEHMPASLIVGAPVMSVPMRGNDADEEIKLAAKELFNAYD